ncbi:MAG: HNH endonuclease [Thermosynechococcaceae cyanobacterium]
MRPVERGLAPRTYAKYGDAIGDLEARLGLYCSYCERRLPTSLAVEHVVPKALNPGLETEWTNFLLGCTNCNSVKGDTPVDVEDFLWPDRDNTFLAFEYAKGGFVRLATNTNKEQKEKAKALLNLVGLQRHQASGWDNPAPRDKRWQQREEIWAVAEKCRKNFESLKQTDDAKNLVLEVAHGYGFFSVWMTVFDVYPDIKRGLVQGFLGTALSCFDADGKPLHRSGGII